MAEGDWEHKDATWSSHRNSADGELSDWLDNHCEGGWEVIKISRNFNSQNQATWVVFRRKED